jgi:Na+-translocating ferredoxin:NAD+ oxidoreductase subunit G
MSKIKFFMQQSWLLILSAFCFGLLLAAAQAGLGPRIDENERKKLNDMMTSLISDANHFEPVETGLEIPGNKAKPLTTDVHRALDAQGETLGFAFIATGPGFADKIKIVIAADRNFTQFFGFKVLASNETPGFGDKIKNDFYGQQFQGAPVGRLEMVKVGDATVIDAQIVAISGATVSSEAVLGIFNTFARNVRDQLIAKGFINNE